VSQARATFRDLFSFHDLNNFLLFPQDWTVPCFWDVNPKNKKPFDKQAIQRDNYYVFYGTFLRSKDILRKSQTIMENCDLSGSVEHARLANQIQGFRIPDG